MHLKRAPKLGLIAQAILVVSFVLALVAPAHAQLSANSTTVNFGNQTVGTQSTNPMLAEFTNTSSQITYNVINVTSSLSQFAYFVAGAESVAPGGVLDIWIWFSPSSVQSYSGTLTLTTDTGYSAQVGLVGNGISAHPAAPAAQGTISLSASSLNFGGVSVGGSGSQVVSITNTGSANVDVANVSTSGAGVAVFGISSGQVLTQGQNIAVYVSYTPSAAGGTSGNVTISSDASNPQAVISVSGSGLGVQVTNHSATLTWNPSTSSGITGYNVYRSFESGGPYSPLTSSVSSTNFTDNGVQAGQTYYYVITAVNSGNVESGYSNEAPAAIP